MTERITSRPGRQVTRRDMALGCGSGLAMVLMPKSAPAAAGDLADDIRTATRGAVVTRGRVKLTMPELAENGNTVALTVSVESPMSASNYVKTVHVFAPENPITTIARFHFNPRSGRAKASTTVRLATSQTLLAVATMSDGTAWSGEAYVLVTLAACLDGG
jgi:sulfur-oxidizing protein SoxY